ncbi:MAG: restriction endonuclease subunit R, partial [Firmicutes bacterium]|nr:restriction endonuclease subunit R [Bacillota bacterium]
KSTFDGEFNALFAVQSVPMLLKYYKIFKDLQPDIKIAAIFTYAPNTSQDDAKTGMNQGFETDSVQADELQAIMDDYNAHFGTAFTTDNFGAYYDDINERMKKRKAGMEPIDLLIVVGMFLTGFDAKKLNTLYVDKNLEYHGLLQAFSRTNRILNEKKRFGKILCFRDLKAKVDESLKLFCDGDPNVGVQRPEFKQVKRELNELSESLLQKYPTMESVDALKSEYDKKKFLLAFRDIIKKHAEIQIYEDYNADDPGLILSEQDYNDYRSKYLDMTVGFIKEDNPEEPRLLEEPQAEYGEGGRLEDIDFCLELLHSDVINVAYILSLISNLNPSDEDYEQKRQEILDTMIKDATMRKKTRLIDGFIKANVDYDKEGFQRAKADGTMDLETRLKDYIIEKKTEAVEELASEEGVDAEALGKYMSEYDYLGREKPEIIQEAVRKKKMGLLARSATVRRIVEKMREIFDLFNWE